MKNKFKEVSKHYKQKYLLEKERCSLLEKEVELIENRSIHDLKAIQAGIINYLTIFFLSL
jgi:hypothetical protein